MSDETAMVNPNTGELVEVREKTPEELLVNARDAARALQSVIQQNNRPPIMFNGKQYLEFPHWQTVAKFYHCAVATKEAEFVEIGGYQGFRAHATVIDERTGIVIGSAEAYCMRDETNWKSKPLFQLASMAQTRAGSKALSNRFRYVAIVAGYEPTPAEEMSESRTPVQQPRARQDATRVSPLAQESSSESKNQTDETNSGSPSNAQETIEFGPPPDVEKPISRAQQNLLYVRYKSAGIGTEKMKKAMEVLCGKKHSKDLTNADLNLLLDNIENGAIK